MNTRGRSSGYTMDSFLRDLRITARSLRRNPIFALVVVLTMALGIGATTTVFSVVYGVLFRPLPFPAADRLVQIVQTIEPRAGGDPFRAGVSVDQFANLTEYTSTLEAVGSWGHGPRTLGGTSKPVRLNGGAVSAGLLEHLGVQPILGRTFRSEDSERGADPVVLVSDRTWRIHLGGSPDVIGTRVLLDEVPTRVIGVMPASFTFPSLASESMSRNSDGEIEDVPEFWIPMLRRPRTGPRPGYSIFEAFALIKPDVTLDRALADVRSVIGPLPDNRRPAVELVSARVEMGRSLRQPLAAFQLGVALILLIACVNVVNLLLARAAGRRRELAIRMALGAGRGRVIREAVAEALLLSCAGGVLGCAIAYGLTRALQVLPPHVLPRLRDIRVDGIVLVFALALSLGSGVAIALWSAWRVSRATAIDDLRQHASGVPMLPRPGRLRPSSTLVVAEIAASVILLSAAGLLVRSFVNYVTLDYGYNRRGLVTFRVSLAQAGYATSEARNEFFDQLASRLTTIPGVVSVAGSNDPIGSFKIGFYPLSVDGRAVAGERAIRFSNVSADYFRTLQIPLIEGREFRTEDRGSPINHVVVNDEFARRYLAGMRAVGRQLLWNGQQLDVIGVVSSTRDQRNLERNPALFFEADYGDYARSVLIVVRTGGGPASILEAARTIVAGIDPRLAPYDAASVDDMLNHSAASPRLYGLVSLSCAVVALLLAAVGLYGVLAYSVGSRTREFGIRMALGARSQRVMWNVLREGLWLAVLGLGFGLAGSYAAAQSLGALLFGVPARDAATFITTAALLLITAACACYLPSRRATRVDPVIALRSE